MSFRALLRPPKRVAASLLQRAWSLCFQAAAHRSSSTVPHLRPRGGQTILIVAPHPDDEAIGCAGTAMLHVDAGDRVHVAIATDGRRSTVIPDAVAMAIQRKREAEDAARLMQVERLDWIGLAEGEWGVEVLGETLRALLEEVAPEIVYAPSRIDFHLEHLKVAHALALALETVGGPQIRVRVYQVQVPLTTLLANLVADVSALVPRCDAVLRAYVSQFGSVHRSYRQRSYAAQRHGMKLQAEEFWEMPTSSYIRLHRAFPLSSPYAFRSLRSFPLTDPLAYLCGREERRAVCAMANAR